MNQSDGTSKLFGPFAILNEQAVVRYCLISVALHELNIKMKLNGVTRVFCPLKLEYVLQPDGTITPVNHMQNYVLSEQQAGEILAQVRGIVNMSQQRNRYDNMWKGF